jgi:UPF0755 protein
MILFGILIVVLLVGVVFVRHEYFDNLRPVNAADTSTQYVTIASGTTSKEIGVQLKQAHLIRSSEAFEWYISSHNYRDKLQAGTYKLSKSESVGQIVGKIVKGQVAADLITILPGKRLDQVRQAFISAGFNTAAVDEAFKADQYRLDYPALADNPAGTDLEGFLYPESFQKTTATDPRQIIGASLEEMQKRLTPDIRNGFVAQGLTVYQGVILASIVEQEVSHPEDRAQVAQVFLKRLRSGVALQSDATAKYGAVKAGVTPSLDYDSAYNTYLHKGLPPSPISNVTGSSLKAVAHPANTDWLYFVSGDDGNTYFSHTLEEHEALTQKYCHKLCGE